MNVIRQVLAASIVSLSLMAGCSKPPEVVGSVSYKGEPIAEGSIQFAPADGQSVSALIKDGSYSITDNERLKEGEYAVRVFAQKATGRMLKSPDNWNPDAPKAVPEYVPMIPPRYNTSTTLTAEVLPGQNSIDFDLGQ